MTEELDLLNQELDTATDGKQESRADVLEKVKLILEKYGLSFHAIDDGSDEIVYRLVLPGFVDMLLYVVLEETEDGLEAFATIGNQDEIDDLMNMPEEVDG